jgi:tartrate-resistant acid phosphatase type 5
MTAYGKPGKRWCCFPPFPQTLEIDEADSHIPTATTTTRMNLTSKTGRLRDTQSEGKVRSFIGPAQPCDGQTAPNPPLVPLPDSLLQRLPASYRDEAKSTLKEPERFELRLASMSDDDLDARIIQALRANPDAAPFLVSQLEKESSAQLRTDIIASLAKYWQAHPEDQPILHRHLLSDPDAGVSIEAYTMLHQLQTDALNKLFQTRLETALNSGDSAAASQLYDAQKQGIRWHYGSRFPAFFEAPPPLFSVEPSGKSIRVLAFGDFGTGSLSQQQTAAAMAEYNKAHPFDFGLTLGDNFYPAGMNSPEDPRWQTQWEQLYGPLSIKFYAVLGNHDWAAPDSPAAEILYSAKSPDWRLPAPYYTFTAGSVQFFAVDTPELDTNELKWLDEQLAASTARWKVV